MHHFAKSKTVSLPFAFYQLFKGTPCTRSDSAAYDDNSHGTRLVQAVTSCLRTFAQEMQRVRTLFAWSPPPPPQCRPFVELPAAKQMQTWSSSKRLQITIKINIPATPSQNQSTRDAFFGSYSYSQAFHFFSSRTVTQVTTINVPCEDLKLLPIDQRHRYVCQTQSITSWVVRFKQ